MALDKKQQKDLNMMNEAARRAKLGDILKDFGGESTEATATKEKAGIVKQCALVSNASGTNVTKEEFNALLAALKAAGIMANS